MRFIPTRVHGLLDYCVGLLLILAPWLLGFARQGAETWVPVALGVGALLYSLCTDYEWGAVRAIPMPVHLGLDFGSGVLLGASPWLFGFAQEVWVPHLAIGLFEIGAALLTQARPGLAGITGRPAGLVRHT